MTVAVHPRWAAPGGRVLLVVGVDLARRRSAARAGGRARRARRRGVPQPDSGSSCPRPPKAARWPSPSATVRRRGRVDRSRAHADDGTSSGRQPGVRRPRPALCDAERRARHEGAGAAVSRDARRHPRAGRRRDRQSDVARARTGRRDVRLEPVRGHRLSRDDRRSRRGLRDRARRADRAGVRRRRVALRRRSIGIDLSRLADQAGRDVRVAAGQRRGVSPRVRAGRLSVSSRRRRWRRATRSIASRPIGSSTSSTRDSAGRRVWRSIRPATCTSPSARPARRVCTASTSAATARRHGRARGRGSRAHRRRRSIPTAASCWRRTTRSGGSTWIGGRTGRLAPADDELASRQADRGASSPRSAAARRASSACSAPAI